MSDNVTKSSDVFIIFRQKERASQSRAEKFFRADNKEICIKSKRKAMEQLVGGHMPDDVPLTSEDKDKEKQKKAAAAERRTAAAAATAAGAAAAAAVGRVKGKHQTPGDSFDATFAATIGTIVFRILSKN